MYFKITTATKYVSLWIDPGINLYVHLSQEQKKQIPICLEMDKIEIPTTSIVIGRCYVQNESSAWDDS